MRMRTTLTEHYYCLTDIIRSHFLLVTGLTLLG
jgi:hypothetical protein